MILLNAFAALHLTTFPECSVLANKFTTAFFRILGNKWAELAITLADSHLILGAFDFRLSIANSNPCSLIMSAFIFEAYSIDSMMEALLVSVSFFAELIKC